MIQKGIFLLVLFFGLSILLTLALSIVMKPEGFVFWAFLYVFSISQIFLFFHALVYGYYTSKKYDDDYTVNQRSSDFDKKTLVIISAFSEDNDVLQPTFDAVKQSFNGPVMLAVDAPKNVNSYIELCKNNDVICLHRIHRSGFKAGAINNVLLNFLANQFDYIKKTRRVLSDEIILISNKSSKMLPFDLPQDLKNLNNALSSVDKILESELGHSISEHISHLTSEDQKKYLQPKNLEILRSKIEYLKKNIRAVMLYYESSCKKLSALNKIVTSVNYEMRKFSSDIESLRLETDSTFNQLPLMQTINLVSKTEDCLKNLKRINGQKFSKFLDKKDILFSVITNIGISLDDVHEVIVLKKDDLISNMNILKNDLIQLNYNHFKKLQANLKTIDSMLVLLDKKIKSSSNDYIFEHISKLISGDQTKHLQPKDLESLRIMIQTQRSKLRDIDNHVESLYEESLYGHIESITSDGNTKLLQLEDLSLLRSKIETLEKKLIVPDMQTKHLQPKDLESLRIMIQTQRSKLRDIDNHVESLYEESLYGHIESITSDGNTKLLQLEDLSLLRSKIETLEQDVNEFHDMTISLVIVDFIPDLKKNLDTINEHIFNPEQFSSLDNVKNNLDKIEDLIAEFDYTVKDLVAKIPLDIEYIVLLDSDAHPKSDSDPQNNFFDLAAAHIQENDLLVFPQFYDKEGGNLVRAAYAQQVPFMKTIMPKRGEDNTAFMLGTNIIVKKKMLEKVGGFDDSTVTEDLATTIKMHESNARSKYINKDVVLNGAPLSIGGYFTQQQRWAYGTYQVFFTMLLKGIGNDLKLKSYIEYLYGNTWYFYGLTFLINALIPFYSIFWEGLIQIPEDLFYILYLPYVFSGIIIFFYSVLRTGHGLRDVFYNMSLNAICFFIYIKALFFILSRKSLPFEVTPKSGSSEETIVRFKKILPILVVIGLLGFSVIVYTIRIITGETSVVAGSINILWSSLFIALLSPVLSFK